MDFYLTCSPCPDCQLKPSTPSAHSWALKLLNFLVATLIEQEEAFVSSVATNSATASSYKTGERHNGALREIHLFLETIRAAIDTTQRLIEFEDPEKYSVSFIQ